MFTGLVEALGTVRSLADEGDAKRIVIEVPVDFLEDAPPNKRLGDSVALNGCCLTVVSADNVLWSFQAGHETLAKTNLGRLRAGDAVNLERAMPADGRFGGHIVQATMARPWCSKLPGTPTRSTSSARSRSCSGPRSRQFGPRSRAAN